MKFTIGFSPCPNDTFIFDALIHHKIDTRGLEFEPILEDVENPEQVGTGRKAGYNQAQLWGIAPGSWELPGIKQR